MKKSNILAAGFAVAAFIGLAFAATTFTNLKSEGTLEVDGATQLDSTVAVAGAATLSSTLAVTGASTLTGAVTLSTVTVNGTQGLRFGISVDTTSTPAAAGILAKNSSNELYISTGTGAAAWVKVGGQ